VCKSLTICMFHFHRGDKREIALEAISKIRKANPGVRFLDHCEDKRSWIDAPEDKLTEKTCQALRERKWTNPEGIVKSVLQNNGSYSPPPLPKNNYSKKLAKLPSKEKETTTSKESSPPVNPSPRVSTVKVGAHLSIFWPLDKAYYGGEVVDTDGDNALIRYDADGLEEWLDISKHEFKVD
jgi:hypothetical protein